MSHGNSKNGLSLQSPPGIAADFFGLDSACLEATALALKKWGAKDPQKASPSPMPKRFTIGIDARVLSFSPSMERGIGAYTRNHLTELFCTKPEWQFILFLEEYFEDKLLQEFLSYPNVTWCAYHDSNHPPLDIFHIPDPMSMTHGYDSPFLVAPQGVPLSVLFHDLIPLTMSQYHYDCWSTLAQISYRNRLKQLEKPSVMVLTNSNYTKQDVMKHCNVPSSRVIPVLAGFNQAIGVGVSNSTAIDQTTLAKYNITTPFFMMVGALDMHKNFPLASRAFTAAKIHRPMKLVMVGGNADPFKEYYRGELRSQGVTDIIWTGFVPQEELAALYRQATALLFPSRYEGFGFPALEAIAAQCPVIASNATSLPEVVGAAGILLDPEDVESWAKSMLALAENPSLRTQLIEQGGRQLAKFSWKFTAEKTIVAWETFVRELSLSKKEQAAMFSISQA